MMGKKFIWLFGENLGETHNNNSFYFWDHCVERDDEIEKYYILIKTRNNREFVKKLNRKKRKNIIWKNSAKHFLLFFKQDMSFVTLSYRDVMPDKLISKNIHFRVEKPLVYLQHGILGMKQIGYTGHEYWNNMFRFVYYNIQIKKYLCEINNFSEYQLYYGQYHPRFKQLVRINREYAQKENSQRILFFFTWREYFGVNKETKYFLESVSSIFSNQFLEYIKQNNIEIVICLHQFFKNYDTSDLKEKLASIGVSMKIAPELDLMKELATCTLLVTDYSSVGFDCTLLKIPVILFQPDFDTYIAKRSLYCASEELKKVSVDNPIVLSQKIMDGNFNINSFFSERLPSNIDYDYIAEGKHIDRMYGYFADKQKNKITFLGYNFSGQGGTVSATKALAEGFAENGYLVNLISLKHTADKAYAANGIGSTAFYSSYSHKIVNGIKTLFFRSSRHYSFLEYDNNKKLLKPYTGYALQKYLKRANSRTIVSTRESLHLFLKHIQNTNINNKLYFFHTDPALLDTYYPGLINKLKEVTLENALFVTESSKENYSKLLGYNNYHHSMVVGNTLESTKYIQEDTIGYEFQQVVTFLGNSVKANIIEQRNILEFVRYLKDKNEKIKVDVYGSGNSLQSIVNAIIDEDLHLYCECKKENKNKYSVIKDYECCIDFLGETPSITTGIQTFQSYRMFYVKNTEFTLSVFDCFPRSVFYSPSDLVEKITSLSSTPLQQYIANNANVNNLIALDNLMETTLFAESKTMKSITEDNYEQISVVSLMRFSKDRIDALENLISFARYIAAKKVNIIVFIYGTGDLVTELKNRINQFSLGDVINYCGATDQPGAVIRKYDCCVDFCNNQSFGMTYIESILNGKMVFAKENTGSLEVLKDISGAYYYSNEDLVQKILNVKSVSKDDLKRNYEIISSIYSRDVVSKKVLTLIN